MSGREPDPGGGRSLVRALRDGLVLAPGVFDGFSAMLAARSRAAAVYLSGYAVAASRHGLPDAGLTGLAELLAAVETVRRVCPLPVVADADTGYGGLLNVQHTVRELEARGVSAVQIEDQEMPKRCGHTRGKHVVDRREMQAKIEVAVETRTSDELLVVARTDARSTHGLDEALARARAYRAAGADLVFVEAPEDEREVERIAGELDMPLVLNVVPAGMRTPPLPARRLAELGFAMAVYPGLLALPALGAMRDALDGLFAEGVAPPPPAGLDPHELVGFPRVWHDEARWQERSAPVVPA